MKPAEIKFIQSNDYPIDWEEFEANPSIHPDDDFGWFSLDIGFEGEEAADIFQVLVSTPKAVSQAKGHNVKFKGIVVDSFLPSDIRTAIHDYVSSIHGRDWLEVVDQLSKKMTWEYEGM